MKIEKSIDLIVGRIWLVKLGIWFWDIWERATLSPCRSIQRHDFPNLIRNLILPKKIQFIWFRLWKGRFFEGSGWIWFSRLRSFCDQCRLGVFCWEIRRCWQLHGSSRFHSLIFLRNSKQNFGLGLWSICVWKWLGKIKLVACHRCSAFGNFLIFERSFQNLKYQIFILKI